MTKLIYCSFILLLAGCSSSSNYIPETQALNRSNLSSPDTTLTIANISSCTDSNDKSVQIDADSPITLLVHGCDGSAGRFRSLAELYAFHGQQAICYSYDDRESLVDNAEKLATAISQISQATNNQKISIIGHSMGGLIARKALEKDSINSKKFDDNNLELITVSAPFSGIDIASQCGIKPLHWLSLGIVPGICWMITGDNWYEITAYSNFIKYPEPLVSSVDKFVKIVTNEENSCRKKDSNGKCIESDYVFSIDEQHNKIINGYDKTTTIQVDAGHVEIVGNKDIVPRKLIAVLQQHGMLSYTPVNRQADFERLLASLYLTP
jgi:hypothetical protein